MPLLPLPVRHDMIPPSLVVRAQALLAGGGRRVLGLAGAPGSGKSTLASALAEAIGPRAALVPMDGFHLANVELARLGRVARKGAPDTFDAHGYVALLRRLRHPVAGETVYAPSFRREIEEPVAGAIPVAPEVRLVITEGNYLLMDGAFAEVRGLLDESWFVATDEALRDAWLMARHVAFGRSAAAARAWIDDTDLPNARLILATRERADLVVDPWAPDPAGEAR